MVYNIGAMEPLNEKCGVFGIYGHDVEVARLTYYGLSALQHRGQESSGIVTSDGSTFYSHTGPGLVAQVYTDEIIQGLKGFVAIGHNRYATSGGKSNDHPQPVLRSDDVMALAHNGNLPSTKALEEFLRSKRLHKQSSNDSEMMTDAIRYWRYQGLTMVDSIKQTWPLMTGAFSCVMASTKRLLAWRDRNGIRPLSLGRLGDAYVVASETCAFDIIGATFVRDIAPGELIEIHEGTLTSHQIEPPNEKLEIFEYIYFARPDSMLQGQSVNQVRQRLGRQLAIEAAVAADVVIPVPDSSIPAAIGYSEQAGLPFDHGLIKNRYIHRTFIRPTQDLRERDVKMKLNPLPSVLKDRDVVVIDDSIVRGTTTKKLVKMLKEVGARKVHLRISCPPVKYPDFYGIDTPDQSQLIAARLKTTEAIRKHIGADTLEYLSYDGMIKAIGVGEDRLCTACFTGNYPIDLLERASEVKAP